jgi:hemerythrin superfamily protein
MNVIDLLMRDHERVRELFESYASLHDEDAGAKRQLVERLHQELEDHAGVEEQLFYPAVDERAGQDLESAALVREAYEEHRKVKSLLSEIADLEPEDEAFPAKLKALQAIVEDHVQEEESTLLPQAKRLLSPGELERLGSEVQQQRAEARTGLLASAAPGEVVEAAAAAARDEGPDGPAAARRTVRRTGQRSAGSRSRGPAPPRRRGSSE